MKSWSITAVVKEKQQEHGFVLGVELYLESYAALYQDSIKLLKPFWGALPGKQPEMCEKVRALYQGKQKEIRMPSSPNLPKDDKDSNTGSTCSVPS